MPVPRKPLARIGTLRRRRRDLLAALAALRDRGAPLAALCERATGAVAEYSEILAENLAQASVSASGVDAETSRRESMRILGEFAASVRDLIPDRDARHALAQDIQCAVLQHERRLRDVAAAAVQT